ncbi:hypothetical protein ES332_A05G165900v1 [Gossypium tomentosum]|uniref:Transmembrane protein n=1 Tax=Gossypium tomentosum TaxID=34277 RepID=A0A5D2QGJ1_GOSTO|nr:hypothetical protein ES332_A05G165900v1 [Gossypium tomentosum]
MLFSWPSGLLGGGRRRVIKGLEANFGAFYIFSWCQPSLFSFNFLSFLVFHALNVIPTPKNQTSNASFSTSVGLGFEAPLNPFEGLNHCICCRRGALYVHGAAYASNSILLVLLLPSLSRLVLLHTRGKRMERK